MSNAAALASIPHKDIIMNRLIQLFIPMIALSATLPALAGPDWQVIEHGRKVKLERLQKRAAADAAATAAAIAPGVPAPAPSGQAAAAAE